MNRKSRRKGEASVLLLVAIWVAGALGLNHVKTTADVEARLQAVEAEVVEIVE